MRALVTGASSGIGAAFAERLAGDGYDLVLVARRQERLDALAERLKTDHGVEAEAVRADLGSSRDLEQVCDRIGSGPALDLLINNAGFGAYMPFVKLPPDEAERLIRVQALAPSLLARAALPAMISAGRGSIVNIASLLAFSAPADLPQLPARVMYAATKSFIVAFSELLSHELKGTGVGVMVVCPGFVKTEFHPVQGLDISSLPFVAPPSVVVEATMAGMKSGELFCLPTLEDVSALERLKTAELELLAGGRSGVLASRYSKDS